MPCPTCGSDKIYTRGHIALCNNCGWNGTIGELNVNITITRANTS